MTSSDVSDAHGARTSNLLTNPYLRFAPSEPELVGTLSTGSPIEYTTRVDASRSSVVQRAGSND
jgi:hypothetical protein